MKNVFEQVMLLDGSRRMRSDIILKTFKVNEVLSNRRFTSLL